MKSIRQIECTELMLSLNNLTVTYAKALLMTTNPSQLLVSPKQTKKIENSAEVIQKKIENDRANLHLQYKAIEQKLCSRYSKFSLGYWAF